MKTRHRSFSAKIFFLLSLLCSGALLTGCGQVTVSQDYDAAFEFQENMTYDWNNNAKAVPGDLLQDNDLLLKRFQAAIAGSLEQKGFFRNDSAPTLLVSCNYTVITRLETEPYNTGISMGVGRYGRYGGIGIGSGTYVDQYDQGQLVVSVRTAEGAKLVWTGLATRQVVQHYTPAEYDKLAHELVTAVMAQFPPQKE